MIDTIPLFKASGVHALYLREIRESDELKSEDSRQCFATAYMSNAAYLPIEINFRRIEGQIITEVRVLSPSE